MTVQELVTKLEECRSNLEDSNDDMAQEARTTHEAQKARQRGGWGTLVDESFLCFTCQALAKKSQQIISHNNKDFWGVVGPLASMIAGKSGCSPYKNFDLFFSQTSLRPKI